MSPGRRWGRAMTSTVAVIRHACLLLGLIWGDFAKRGLPAIQKAGLNSSLRVTVQEVARENALTRPPRRATSNQGDG